MSKSPESEPDLDVDLFDFDPVPDVGSGDDVDLDSIFNEFESLEREERERQERTEAVAEGTATQAPAPPAGGAPSAAAPQPAPAAPAPAAPGAPQPNAAAEQAARQALEAERLLAVQALAGTAAPVAAAPPARSSLLNRSTLLILVAMTSLNAFMAVVALNRSSQVGDMGRQMVELAETIERSSHEVPAEPQARPSAPAPVVAPTTDGHPVLDQAFQEIESGRFADARRRIYALLAIIDRVDPEQRREVESRAQFLLAEAAHLQALRAMEVRE